MEKLQIELENCYGIRSLKAELSFHQKKANIIYAPNGSMKTSFAATFKDLSEGKDSRDRIFKDAQTVRKILDEDGAPIKAEEVFVIEPYVPQYESAKISTLLVNSELKKEYDETIAKIDKKKDDLLKELRTRSGLKREEIEAAISIVVSKVPDKFFNALDRLEKEVLEEGPSQLASVQYSNIFNEKVEKFLATKDFKQKLEEYVRVYDDLVSKSTFFRKGVFNHYQAAEIAKNLKSHGFFKAEHSIYLNPKSTKREITTEQELQEVIEAEKQAIMTDPVLRQMFDELEKPLSANQDLRDFQNFLLANQFVIPEFSNLELLKEKLWKAYLFEIKEIFQDLLAEYENGKKRIGEITDLASSQATEWQGVLNIFNRRFSVPFQVTIENKQDVILKRVTPNIRFEFVDDEGKKQPVERSNLIDVLSNGERRALYLLNIIFEIEARKKSGTKTLFIVDDIADSFDYKNKYAIVEYLDDILQEGDFCQIILTHNYDFYRTVSKRLDLGGARYHVVRTVAGVMLQAETMYRDPFDKWKASLANPDRVDALIAMVPFVRNLADYCGYSAESTKLTSLLHIKQDTSQINFNDLEVIYNTVLRDVPGFAIADKTRTVFSVIDAEAQTICADHTEGVALEKKIVMSIAIRLRAETFLIAAISEPAFVANLAKDQTAKLIRKYKEKFANDTTHHANFKVIDRVALMTPENIHLNSFMYEPILDLSCGHLRRLYNDVAAL